MARRKGRGGTHDDQADPQEPTIACSKGCQCLVTPRRSVGIIGQRHVAVNKGCTGYMLVKAHTFHGGWLKLKTTIAAPRRADKHAKQERRAI